MGRGTDALALCGMPVCGAVPVPTDRGLFCRTRGRRGPGRSAAGVRTAGRSCAPVLLFVVLPCFLRRLSPPAGFCVRPAVGANGRAALRSCGGCLECFFKRPNGRDPETVGKAGAWAASSLFCRFVNGARSALCRAAVSRWPRAPDGTFGREPKRHYGPRLASLGPSWRFFGG